MRKSIPISELKIGSFHNVEGKRLQVNKSAERYQKQLRYLGQYDLKFGDYISGGSRSIAESILLGNPGPPTCVLQERHLRQWQRVPSRRPLTLCQLRRSWVPENADVSVDAVQGNASPLELHLLGGGVHPRDPLLEPAAGANVTKN